MARIPDAEIERLKAEVSLERLVETSGVRLAKRGGDLVGCCPFHDEDTPSFVVTPTKNLFHCFGCGAAGGVIDWGTRRQALTGSRWAPLALPSFLYATPTRRAERSRRRGWRRAWRSRTT